MYGVRRIYAEKNVLEFPEKDYIALAIGNIYLSLNRKEEAIKFYKKTLELNAEMEEAKNRLKELEIKWGGIIQIRLLTYGLTTAFQLKGSPDRAKTDQMPKLLFYLALNQLVLPVLYVLQTDIFNAIGRFLLSGPSKRKMLRPGL